MTTRAQRRLARALAEVIAEALTATGVAAVTKPEPTPYLRQAEAARELAVSRAYVGELCAAGTLVQVRIGKRAVRVTRKSVEEFKSNREKFRGRRRKAA